MFGFQPPFTVTTCQFLNSLILILFVSTTSDTNVDAAILLVSSQITNIIEFFVSRNIRIARDRAWDQTVISRGKGPEFWQPYVEEWSHPPTVTTSKWDSWLSGWFGRVIVRRAVSVPLSLYPFIGIAFDAYIKSVATAKYLHKPVCRPGSISRDTPSNEQ